MNIFHSSLSRLALALCVAALLSSLPVRGFAQEASDSGPSDEPVSSPPESEATSDPEETDSESEPADTTESEPPVTDESAVAENDDDTSTTTPAELDSETEDDQLEEDLAAESADALASSDEAMEEPPPRQPSPFRGSLFSWQHGLTVNTLDPSAQLTYDPTYYWSFFLQGRYYLDAKNFLVLSQGLAVELTNAGYTTTEREPMLSDTTLEWRHIEVFEGFVFIPSVRLAAPLSNWSQAADRIINTGVGLTVVKVFPELASFTVALSGGYRRWWATSNTVVYRDQATCVRGPTAEQVCGAGATTERDRFISALTLTVMPLPGLTVLTQYAFSWVYGHDIAPARIGTVDYTDDGNHWRNFHYWALAVGYDVVQWLNIQIGYQSASVMTNFWNDDGTVRNPFYNPESEIYLSATLALDVFVDDLTGDRDEVSPQQLQRRRQGLAGLDRASSF